MKVGYLGPEGTFTHGAVRTLRPGDEHVPTGTQAEAFDGLDDGRFDAVVLPLDNSVHGPVLPTWDALLSSRDAVIVDDTQVAVTFDAFAADPTAEHRTIVSHPHALAQVSRFVDKLGLPVRTATSTAEACRSVARDEIAVGAPIAGEMYGLARIESGIEDLAGGATQFGLIARPGSGVAPRGSSAPTLQVLAVVPQDNVPGALLRVIEPIRAQRLNLVNVVTKRVAQSDSEVVFLLFVDGVTADAQARALVGAVAASGVVVDLGRLQGQVRHVRDVARELPRRLRRGSPGAATT
jgi:prephenate dehydratase/chorismate mutase/prephenate dehydratase